jgi:hypothetical protein
VLRRGEAGRSNWIVGDGIKVPKRGKKMPTRGESAIGVGRFRPPIARETYVVGRRRKEPLKALEDLEDNIFANNPFLDDLLEWRSSPGGEQFAEPADALCDLMETCSLMPSNANLSGLTESRSTSINLLSTSKSNIPASVVTGSAAMPGTRRSSLSTRRRGRFDVKVSRNRTPSLRRALGPRTRRVLRAQPSRLPYIRGRPRGFAIQDDGREPAAVGRHRAAMCAMPMPFGSNDCVECVGARRPRATKPQPASATRRPRSARR